MSEVNDMRWTIIGEGRSRRYVLCRCSCAAQTVKEVDKYNLRNGKTRSCGCLNSELLRISKYKHGLCVGPDFKLPPEYRVWSAIRERCHNSRSASYKHYGKRGISVCARWCESFDNFLADVGTRPTPQHSLDRINNDGNYEPGNVRWATKAEQVRNRRNTVKLTYKGITQSIAAWSEEVGIGYGTIKSRIKYGWSVERILTEPVYAYRNNKEPQL